MVTPLRVVAVAFAVLLFAASAALAADTVKCTECGMTCEIGAKFTARIIQGEQTYYFCDIGDLFTYLGRKKPSVTRVEVKNFPSGEWIDAHKAYFVHSEKMFKTPMGWGIAAFLDKNKALEFGAAMDFDGAARAVK